MTNCGQELNSGMKSQPPKVRDERIDSVKFWLIVLVIAIHVCMRKEFARSVPCVALWNWLCIFIMPLFIFISGYYSRKKDKKDFWPSIWKILEPLLVFHGLALLFYVKSWTVETILSPWYLLWYLLSLIYWRLFLQFIPDKVLNHRKLVLVITFCVGILVGFLPVGKLLSIQRTFALMPFFFLGYFMKGKNLYLPDKYKPLCMAFLAVTLAMAFFLPHRILHVLLYANPYKSIYEAAVRIIAFTAAIPISIAFINVCGKTAWTSRQGRMTIQYYIYHSLLIPANSSPILPPLVVAAGKLNLPMSFGTAAMITMATTLGIYLVLKIPCVRMLTNPSSFILKS